MARTRFRPPSDLAAAAALAGASFALYAAGACRTIYVGDSGELVAASWTLGIPHPSGYPLYVLLGKLWATLLPFGSVAFRFSLFSCACAALAVAGVYLAARTLAVGRMAALAAAVLFAASPSFWGEANVQRVYALNALFVALATLLAARWENARTGAAVERGNLAGRFVAIAFVAGLGATNHTFLAVWGIAFLLYAAVAAPAVVLRGRTLAAAAAATLAGLSVYAYLPLRSRMEPRLDWGNPERLGTFVAVITRHDFWERKWWTGWGDLLPIVRDFLSSFAFELTLLGALLAATGLVAGWRRRRFVAFLGLVAIANVAAMAAHGSRSDLFLWHRYYISAYLMAVLLAGVGLDLLTEAFRRHSRITAAVFSTMTLAAALTLAPLRAAQFDRSRYRVADDYSRQLLASLPPGAHLAASDDNILFVLIYLQLVEGVRPDVDLILQGVGGDLPPLHFNPDTEPLFFTHHPGWNLPELRLAPVGLTFEVARAGTAPALRLPQRLWLEGEDDAAVPKDYLTHNLIGEFHFMLGVTFETTEPERALAELATAARAAPENDVLFYNLGLVYARMGRNDLALAAFERSQAINPRPIPGAAKVRAADRIEELRRNSG